MIIVAATRSFGLLKSYYRSLSVVCVNAILEQHKKLKDMESEEERPFRGYGSEKFKGLLPSK